MSDIFDYPAKYEELVRTYTPGPIFAALILPVVLNVVPDLLVASLPGTTHASFAPHLTSPDGPTSPAVWLLTLQLFERTLQSNVVDASCTIRTGICI